METIVVPEVKNLPELSPNEEDAVAFADMVLTALFGHEVALLDAEHHDTEKSVTWFVRSRCVDGIGEGVPVALSPSLGSFRSVLARFGHHYMGGQLYHGFAMRILRQNDRCYGCLIYTSNMGQSGFWIRVYASKI